MNRRGFLGRMLGGGATLAAAAVIPGKLPAVAIPREPVLDDIDELAQVVKAAQRMDAEKGPYVRTLTMQTKRAEELFPAKMVVPNGDDRFYRAWRFGDWNVDEPAPVSEAELPERRGRALVAIEKKFPASVRVRCSGFGLPTVDEDRNRPMLVFYLVYACPECEGTGRKALFHEADDRLSAGSWGRGGVGVTYQTCPKCEGNG